MNAPSLLGRQLPEQLPVVEVGVADVFERAADLLGEFGWCQDRVGSKHEGKMCALGAILEATNDLGIAPPIYNDPAMTGAWASLTGSGAYGDFNDALGRTKAEVVATLRAASRVARSGARQHG